MVNRGRFQDDRDVAVKKIQRALVDKQIEREIKALTDMDSHENVVR